MITEEDDSFLGVDTATVSQEWTIPVTLNQDFKIDTGADVTVIPRDGVRGRPNVASGDSTEWSQQTSVCGKFQGSLQRNITKTKQDIYVVRGLQKPLLGRPAIEALRVVTIHFPTKSGGRDLFEGLGKLQDNYQIKLKDDARPFALTTPRRVAYVQG